MAISLTLMLKTTRVELSAQNLGFVDENNTMDGVGVDREIGITRPGAKSQTNFQVKWAKFKNTIWSNFLAKSKLLAKPSFKAGFLTLGAQLIFVKWR